MVEAHQAHRQDRQLRGSPRRVLHFGANEVVMDDGTEDEFGAGDLMICPPGHDAWIVGSEACVVIDWQGFADYAKR
jgi:hypothetical protein